MAGDGAGRWGNWESSSDRSSNYGSANDWAENWSYRSSWRSGGSDDSAWTMRSGWHDNWSYRSRPASRGGSWDDYAWDEWYDPNQRNLQPEVYEGPVDGRAHRSEQVQRPAEGHGDDGVRALQPEQELQPASPQAKEVRDGHNRPSGHAPSGVPSIAGNSHGGTSTGATKLSSSYPPIFNARPGESWVQYWRTVQFWMASEGKALPLEMRGPRLMQQLRERAGKIVQHLSVEDVSSEQGLDLIQRTMERSPIIKLLDQKRVDQRRQKFMRLSRLAHESIESFLNRAEIYRKENETAPAYQVGSKFYIGHLLDAAKLTKRDLALVKAASGGTLDDEDLVIAALMDLAEQLEGQPGCPIGKGEPTLGRRFGRGGRRFRDALMAILEDEEGQDDDLPDDEPFGDQMGEESLDEDEDDPTSFAPPSAQVFETSTSAQTSTAPSSATSTASSSLSSDVCMAEIYAQEYKARNRVREIKRMRQYFQKEAAGGPAGGGKDREQVRRWVKEQQKTEPCFICRQYRNKAPIHATNVTFQTATEPNWDLLAQFAQPSAQYKERDGSFQGDPSRYFSSLTVNSEKMVHHDVCWSMQELGNKMILDLGCMKTVAGTTWINPLVTKWKQCNRYFKVVPEEESFRFGDGHVNKSRYAVILIVMIADIPCALRISVVGGDCPPLLSKPVCTALGLVVDRYVFTCRLIQEV